MALTIIPCFMRSCIYDNHQKAAIFGLGTTSHDTHCIWKNFYSDHLGENRNTKLSHIRFQNWELSLSLMRYVFNHWWNCNVLFMKYRNKKNKPQLNCGYSCNYRYIPFFLVKCLYLNSHEDDISEMSIVPLYWHYTPSFIP